MNSVREYLLTVTLLVMLVVSRWAMVYTSFAYPCARPSGMGSVFKKAAGWPQFVLATLVTLAVTVVLAGVAGLVLMAGIWVVVVLMAAYLRSKFAGLTGDNYGAVNEIAEACALIFILILAKVGLI